MSCVAASAWYVVNGMCWLVQCACASTMGNSAACLYRGIVGMNLQPSSRGPRGVTEMGYPMYPPSLYRAISYASKLGVPMYITENGTPLTEDTAERSEWITGYLEQVAGSLHPHTLAVQAGAGVEQGGCGV